MMIGRNHEFHTNPGKMHGSSLGGLPGGNEVSKFEKKEISKKVRSSQGSSEGTTTEPAIEVTKTKYEPANEKVEKPTILLTSEIGHELDAIEIGSLLKHGKTKFGMSIDKTSLWTNFKDTAVDSKYPLDLADYITKKIATLSETNNTLKDKAKNVVDSTKADNKTYALKLIKLASSPTFVQSLEKLKLTLGKTNNLKITDNYFSNNELNIIIEFAIHCLEGINVWEHRGPDMLAGLAIFENLMEESSPFMYIAKQLITPTESNQDQYKKEIDFSNLTRDILEVSEKFKEEALEEMVRKSETYIVSKWENKLNDPQFQVGVWFVNKNGEYECYHSMKKDSNKKRTFFRFERRGRKPEDKDWIDLPLDSISFTSSLKRIRWFDQEESYPNGKFWSYNDSLEFSIAQLNNLTEDLRSAYNKINTPENLIEIKIETNCFLDTVLKDDHWMKFLQENQITTTVNQSEVTAAEQSQLESNAPMKTLLTELSNWPIDQLTSSKIEDSKTLYDVLLQIQNLSESPVKNQLELILLELIQEGPKKTEQIQSLSEILEKDWITLFKGEPESAEAFPSIQYDLLKILTSKSKEELTAKNDKSLFSVMSKIKDTSTNQLEILTTALKEILKGAKSEMSQKLERLGVLTDPSFEQLTYDITTALLNIDSKYILSKSKDLKNSLKDAYKLFIKYKELNPTILDIYHDPITWRRLELLVSINRNSPPDKIPGFAISILEVIHGYTASNKLPIEVLLESPMLNENQLSVILFEIFSKLKLTSKDGRDIFSEFKMVRKGGKDGKDTFITVEERDYNDYGIYWKKEYKLIIRSNKLFLSEQNNRKYQRKNRLRENKDRLLEHTTNVNGEEQSLTLYSKTQKLTVSKYPLDVVFVLFLQKAEFLSKKYPSITTKFPNCITAPIIEEKIKTLADILSPNTAVSVEESKGEEEEQQEETSFSELSPETISLLFDEDVYDTVNFGNTHLSDHPLTAYNHMIKVCITQTKDNPDALKEILTIIKSLFENVNQTPSFATVSLVCKMLENSLMDLRAAPIPSAPPLNEVEKLDLHAEPLPSAPPLTEVEKVDPDAAPIPLAPPLIEVEKVENVIQATKQGEYFELEPFQEEFAQPNSPHTRLLSLPHQTIEEYIPFNPAVAKRIDSLSKDELIKFNDLFNIINNLKTTEEEKNTLMGLLFQLLDSKYEDTVAFRKVNDAYQFLIKSEPDSSEYSISQALKLVTLCPYATIGGLDSTIPTDRDVVIPQINDTLNEVANFLNPPRSKNEDFFTSDDSDLKSKILTSWLQAQTNQSSSMIKVRNLCSNILHLNGSSLSTPLTLQSYAKICEILYKNKDLEKTLDDDFQNFKKNMRDQQNRINLGKHVFFKESKSNSLKIIRNALKNISSILSGAAAELEITPENLMALHLFDPFDSKATDLDLDQSLSTQDLEGKKAKKTFSSTMQVPTGEAFPIDPNLDLPEANVINGTLEVPYEGPIPTASRSPSPRESDSDKERQTLDDLGGSSYPVAERLTNKDQSEAAIDGSQEHREPYFETPPFDDPTEYDTLKRSELRRELLERRKIENAQNEKITAQEKEIKKLKEELLFTQYLTASTSQDSGTENITEKSNDSLKVSNVEDNQVNSQEVFFDDGYDSLSEEEEEE